MTLNKPALLPAAIALACLSVTAQAQEQQNEQDQLQEYVLVTATRISQDAQSMPMGWSAVNEDALALTGHIHINELMQRVPGVWISRGNGQESLPSLRSPVLTGAGSCGDQRSKDTAGVDA